MAQVNPLLIKALMSKLNVKQSRVYARIAKIASDKFLENDAAALLLAKEAGINPKKFSTPQQRALLRAGTQHAGSTEQGVSLPDTKAAQTHTQARNAKAKHPSGDGKSIFVVHGRDAELRKEFFAFLRSLNLNPFEWGTALKEAKKGANPNVESVIDACMAKVQAVVVLFSPDEEVLLTKRLRTRRDKTKPELQPRPNVIFEAGLALGRHPEKTLLIEIGSVRGFSDIAGRHMARLTNDVSSRNDIITRLRMLKCKVEASGNDWITEGTFPVV